MHIKSFIEEKMFPQFPYGWDMHNTWTKCFILIMKSMYWQLILLSLRTDFPREL